MPRGSARVLWSNGAPLKTPENGLARHPAVIHHGATHGVTGSCNQLQDSADHSVLIDFGLFQGENARRSPGLHIDFPIVGIQALLLTHITSITSAAFRVCWRRASVGRSFTVNLAQSYCPWCLKMHCALVSPGARVMWSAHSDAWSN